LSWELPFNSLDMDSVGLMIVQLQYLHIGDLKK
jgi:hypothetical protein